MRGLTKKAAGGKRVLAVALVALCAFVGIFCLYTSAHYAALAQPERQTSNVTATLETSAESVNAGDVVTVNIVLKGNPLGTLPAAGQIKVHYTDSICVNKITGGVVSVSGDGVVNLPHESISLNTTNKELIISYYGNQETAAVSFNSTGKVIVGKLLLCADKKGTLSAVIDAEGSGCGYSGSTTEFAYTAGSSVSFSIIETTYKVTFAGGEGAVGEVPTIGAQVEGAEIVLPSCELTRAGYTFAGWKTGTTTYLAGETYTMGEGEVTFTAQWEENAAVTITYVSADEATGSVSVASEELAPVTGVAAGAVAQPKAGYVFVSWTNAEGEVVCSTAAFVPEKVEGLNVAATYTANFREEDTATYTVKHVQQNVDGTWPETAKDTETVSGEKGALTQACAKVYEGFTAQPFSQATIAVDGSTVVEIRYERKSFMVTFDSNGGTAIDAQSVLFGAQAVKPATPTKDGFVFGGWMITVAGKTAGYDFDEAINGDVLLTAKWTETKTTIKEEEGVTVENKEEVAKKLQEEAKQIIEDVAEGKTPEGLTESQANEFKEFLETKEGVEISLEAGVSKGEVSDYAEKAIDGMKNAGSEVAGDYKIAFTLVAEDEEDNKMSQEMSSSSTEASFVISLGKGIANKVVRLFAVNEKGEVQEFFNYAVDRLKGTITFTASSSFTLRVLQSDNAEVCFESNGGTAIANVAVAFGEKLVEPTVPERLNYDFAGWYSDSECTKAYNFDKEVTENMTLYAKWTAAEEVATSKWPLFIVITLGVVVFLAIFAGFVVRKKREEEE